MSPLRHVALIACLAAAACDKLGIPSEPSPTEEAKAVGAACRHSGRALSDCYASHANMSKSAIFAGWREMNDYMTDKKISEVEPAGASAHKSAETAESKSAETKAAETKAAETKSAEAKASPTPSKADVRPDIRPDLRHSEPKREPEKGPRPERHDPPPKEARAEAHVSRPAHN